MHCLSLMISFKCLLLPQICFPSDTTPSFPFPSLSPRSNSASISSVSSSISFHPKLKARAIPEPTAQDQQEDFQVLTAIKTEYNDIFILDTPKSRLLLLDSTRMLSFNPCPFGFFPQCHVKSNQTSSNSTFTFDADNVHSILNKEEKRTGSYWVCADSFPLASLCIFLQFIYDQLVFRRGFGMPRERESK